MPARMRDAERLFSGPEGGVQGVDEGSDRCRAKVARPAAEGDPGTGVGALAHAPGIEIHVVEQRASAVGVVHQPIAGVGLERGGKRQGVPRVRGQGARFPM